MGLFTDVTDWFGQTVSDIQKATKMGANRYDQSRGPGVALVVDPDVWAVAGVAHKEKPQIVNYTVLRYLCKRDTVLAMIILTRLRQVKAFSRIRTHEEAEKTNATGFRVKIKFGAGDRSPAVETREDELNSFISRCCRVDVPQDKRVERSFASFLWRFTKDRLTIDQACAEIQLDRNGLPVQFYAVDGSTIRIVDPTKRKDSNQAYIQLFNNMAVATFTDNEMMFCPENVSSELCYSGYALAETEIALKKVMAHLGIDETNSRQFHPGSMPKGLIALTGADISEDQLQVLEAKYKTQVATYRGKHRIPLLPIPRGGKMDFIHFPQASDIEFGNFLDYLVNTVTALFGMDPAEVNFPNRSGGIAGASPAMIQSSPEATRLTASRDKGLRTLLAFLEDCINEELMPLLDPTEDFEFSFIGFDRQTDQERLDHDDKKSKVYSTINEIREGHGLKPRDDGDVIRDPIWLQAKQGAEQMAMQQQGDDAVEGGEAGGDGWESSTTPALKDEQWDTGESEMGDLW